jgi:membrane associated rhomboid family serine protease
MSRIDIGARRPTPVVLTLIVSFVILFIATALLVRFAPFGHDLYGALILNPPAVVEGRVWTLLTYALLHDLGSTFHMLLNGLMLYFFGPELETRWGRRRFILFVVLTALGGGLAVMAAWSLGLSAAPVIGASGIVLGLIVAWGLTFPDRQILLFFVLPVRGIHVVWISVGFALLDAVSLGPVSASAHIGGMATAALLVLGLWRPNTMKLWLDDVLVALRIRKKAKLTLVPPPKKGSGKGPDGWVH